MDLERETNPIRLLFAKNISENNLVNLEKLLNKLPFPKLNNRDFEIYFILFLNYAAKKDRPEAYKLILDKFTANNIGETEEQHLRMIDKIWVIPAINDESRAMLLKLFPDRSYMDHMRKFINNDASPDILTACHRLESAFGPQSLKTYKEAYLLVELQQDQEGYCNETVRKFLQERIRSRKTVSEQPKWIIPLGESRLSLDDLLEGTDSKFLRKKADLEPPGIEESDEFLTFVDVVEEKDMNQVVKEFVEGKIRDGLLQSGCLDVNALSQSGLVAAYERMLPSERKALFSAQEVQNGIDTEYFRFLGPVNISYPEQVQDICVRYGGCRMLTCNCCATNDASDDDFEDHEDGEVDWFTGRCDYPKCGKEIEKRQYAVRSPFITTVPGSYEVYRGSWVGCYCKWKHAKKDIVVVQYNPISYKDVDYKDVDPLTAVRFRLIDFYKVQMKRNGIYDH